MMSLMSTGRASLKPAVGAEFMVPGTWTARSAPSDTAGPAAGAGGGQQAGASERAQHDLRGTELYFRTVHVRTVQVRTVQVRAGQVRTGQVRAGQVRPGQVRPGQVRTGQVRQVRAGGHEARPLWLVGPRARQVRPREPGVRRHQPDKQPVPVRLTRRGRAVAAVLTILAVTAVAAVLWLSLAAGAQAASHGQPAGAGYRGMTQVVVRPGQTLWSIASAAEPATDTRIVIQQIMDANALGSTSIQAGELLWVPKG